MSASSSDFSKIVASLIGETHGRSTSRVLADGLVSGTKGAFATNQAMDLVHVGMAGVLLAAVAPKQSTLNMMVVGGALLAFGALWIAGQSYSEPHW